MPSAGDFFNEMKATNVRLDTLNATTSNVLGEVQGANTRLDTLIVTTNGVRVSVDNVAVKIDQQIAIETVIRDAVIHQIKQNETIICLLKQIADNTCRTLNEAHIQTGLQTTIRENTTTLAELYAVTHAEAALVRDRELALKKQLEKCCPPPVPEPACRPKECPAPGEFKVPPPPIILLAPAPEPGKDPGYRKDR